MRCFVFFKAMIMAAMVAWLPGCLPEDELASESWQVTAEDAHGAGQLGMNYLTQATVDWQNRNPVCFACHIQGMSMWGVGIGIQRGYTVDGGHLNALSGRVLATQAGDGAWGTRFATAFAASGLAYYDRHATRDTAELKKSVEWLLSRQDGDGKWQSEHAWPPGRSEIFEAQDLFVTMASVVAVARVAEVTQQRIYEYARDRGVNWLSSASHGTTQGRAFKLIGLVEGGLHTDGATVAAAREDLLSHQNGDGGFGVVPGAASTSFHTGLAIYALRLAGMDFADRNIQQGLNWLMATQTSHGPWPRGDANLDTSDPVAPTMWPVIALGEFGEKGVDVAAEPAEAEVDAGATSVQVVEYTVPISNKGSTTDTYDLRVTGGAPGFSTALSADVITLDPEPAQSLGVPGAVATQDVTLYVLAPAELPPGLSVLHTVVATSRSNINVTAAVTVNTRTAPDSPLSGHRTRTTLTQGAGVTIATGDELRIAAQVIDRDTGVAVSGPNAGMVNFVVAGLAVGSDDDSDGDGEYAITWKPIVDWPKLGEQSVIAVYSGIDRPAPGQDLMASNDVRDIYIEATADSACGNTAILVAEARDALDGMDRDLLAALPGGVAAKRRVLVAKLNNALALMDAGLCADARDRLESTFAQRAATSAQIAHHGCESKRVAPCLDAGPVEILLDALQNARDLCVRARDGLDDLLAGN